MSSQDGRDLKLCATKKPIDNSVAERQPGEHDSSLDVDGTDKTTCKFGALSIRIRALIGSETKLPTITATIKCYFKLSSWIATSRG